MAGKREKPKKRTRLPGVLAIVAVLAALLAASGPAGVAADSPVERMMEPWSRTAETAEPAADAQAADQPEETEPEADSEPDAEPEEPAAEGPTSVVVPESGPVADTYFDDVVFLGDSRTEGFSLYSGLGTGSYYYAVGATVESVFTKKAWETPAGKVPLLDAVAEEDCGKIYVMLGVNELGWSKVETFRDQYAKVIDRLREDHPDAEVVLQSLLPVSAKQDEKGSYVNNDRIRVYNEALLELAEEKDCPYLNVAEAVADETGCLRADWNFDGVHLNVKGCQAWLEYLRTHPVGEAPETAEPVEEAGTVEITEDAE